MSKPLVKKIYINPGHSDSDPGAVGYETERELNVKVSNYQRDYLLANYDCEIRMNPGTMDSLSAIANDANNWGADLFVSNHFNAGGGDGYEALIYSNERKELGEIFEKHVKAVGQNSRGVKLRPDLAVLKLTNMPAVLNEGAFVDNKTDIQDWNDDDELKKLGEAYAKATAEFLSIPVKKNAATNVKTTENVSCPTIKSGSTGTYVKKAQERLNVHGASLNVDGDFGNLTLVAVKKFQKDKGLDVDGVVGPKTWAALETEPEKVESTTKIDEFKTYTVKVTSAALNVRSGPGMNYGINACIRDRGTYTIIAESNGWGKLKSGAGWINLNYTKKN